MVNAVTYILENNAGVQALVGLNKERDKYKVYPVMVPISEVEPYIAVRLMSKTLIAVGCGYNYRFQTTCYDASYDAVTTLNDAIRTALEGQASGTINGVDFAYLNFITEHDEFTVDRISITFEHGLYMKVSTFEGIAS